MERNLMRRIETCFPILDPVLAQRVFDEELANYLRDNQQAWRLHPDGRYSRILPAGGEAPYSAQGELLETLAR
jgi:polyphosphate kinase